MKWKYLLPTVALSGMMGAGVYFRSEIDDLLSKGEGTAASPQGKSPDDLRAIVQEVYKHTRAKQPDEFAEQFSTLKEDLIIFTHQRSDDIVAGKYDGYIRKAKRSLAGLFAGLEEGQHGAGRLYGQLGEKVNSTLREIRREICRPEIQQLSNDIKSVLEKYGVELPAGQQKTGVQ